MNHSVEDYKSIPPNYSEWILMIIWSFSIFILSILGNTVVLVATLKYNAIKLDEISVALIRNIAVADLGVAAYIVSTLPGIIKRKYLYSDFFCSFSKTWFYSCMMAEVVLLAALSISKLLWILKPLQALSRSKKNGNIIAAVIWMTMICLAAATTIYRESANDNWTVYENAIYQCSRQNVNKSSGILFKSIVMSFNAVPQVVITVATVWLLALVRKAGQVHRQGLITIILVCALFFVSHAPYGCLYQVLKMLNVKDDWMSAFYRWSYYIVYLNYTANPFLYYASIDSFQRFVKQRVFRTEPPSLSDRSTSHGYASHIRSSSFARSRDYNMQYSIIKQATISKQVSDSLAH